MTTEFDHMDNRRKFEILIKLTLLLVLPATVHADSSGFLSKSKIFMKAGVTIIPAQIGEKKEVLPVLQSDVADSKFLISRSGLVELVRGNPNAKVKLNVRTCGTDEMAVPWTIKGAGNADGIFVAFGSGVSSVQIKWTPGVAKRIESPPACSLYKDSYRQTELAAVEVSGLAGTVFYSMLKSPEQLTYEKAYAVQKNQKGSQAKVDCTKSDLAYQKVGIFDPKSCKVLVESPVNCEGQGYRQGSLSKPLGLIEIRMKNETERWLIFSASGYEGDAYLGVNITKPSYPAKESEVDFYVYSGC